ncbi:peptidoglycan DD-metalloendopeptidase family protein [Geitlerinema sp. PCC 9228]|jgi:murein DD-endopeptidase MepM/ murein hydrolase activator NlpD|uniref:peptidoglycan DD-metalloendopeptidase family protein n=1 Tax=Geitlerinema sp. PCC 9228 TaxID=111611 RepID=UPI0008F9CECF|nr:peptidoglycan DD-metalloendopeptidase family protein [Geitlerinema sp. PCC 9228]
MMDNSRQALPEKDRKVRSRTSAATLGLAIAMGTSSFIVLRQGERVMAAEPIADEALGDASLTDERTSSEAAEKATTDVSKSSPEFVTHVVQENENLWTLARMYGTPVRAIAEANDLQLTVLLHVGQELKIPHPQNPAPEAANRTVASGKGSQPPQFGTQTASLQPWQAATTNASSPATGQESTSQSAAAGTRKDHTQTTNTPLSRATATPEDKITGENGAIATVPAPSSSKASPESNGANPPIAGATKKAETDTTKAAGENGGTPQLPEVPSLSSSIDVPPLSRSLVPPAANEPADKQTPQLPTLASQTLLDPLAAGAIKHRVRPGDTIYSLARQYEVSRSEIIEANQIENPNLIEVGQVLAIPQPVQPVLENEPTIAFNVGTNGSTIAPLLGGSAPDSNQSNTAAVLPDLQLSDSLTDTAPLVGAEGSTIVGVDRQTGSLQMPSNQMVDNLEATGSIAYRLSQESNTTNETSKYQPYVEGLRAEISRLRDRSQQEAAPSLAAEATNTGETTLPSILSNSDGNNGSNQPAASTERLNPEFTARDRAQEGTAPTASSSNAGDSETVAVAPLGVENYAPMMPPRMVSPELPPLPEPNRMIPEGEASFNGYIWPAKGVLTSGYGWRWGRMHRGIDIAGPIGTPIVAAASGVVTEAGWNSGGYGNLVEIQHSDGSLTLYAHNSRILVGKGQRVEQGQQVAEMGSTGYSTGPHLHFEIHPPGQGAVDPLAYLPPKRGR